MSQKFKQLQKIKELYSNGENIIEYLKIIGTNEVNTIEDILISYDFQSGSYIQGFAENREYNQKYCGALAKLVNNLGNFGSIMEVGVGECTTLNTVIDNISEPPPQIFGFDISWSRLKFGKELLKDLGKDNVKLFTANLFEIPLLESSIDIVYTSHSIEPNGGNEEAALRELYRVTKKYLILLEPAFEFANDEGRARMKKHGYITELYSTALKLNYNIIEHRPFDYHSNPLNPTGLIIIEKKEIADNAANLVCPISKTDLIKYSDSLFYSKDSLLAYPIIDEIPCLLKENSILATHLFTDYRKFKLERNISFNKNIIE